MALPTLMALSLDDDMLLWEISFHYVPLLHFNLYALEFILIFILDFFQTLDYIRDFLTNWKVAGVAPSWVEVEDRVGLNTNLEDGV